MGFQPCTLNLWTECITGKLNMFVLVLSVQIEDECIISKLNLVRSKLQSHFDGSVQMEEVSEAFHLLCRHTREGCEKEVWSDDGDGAGGLVPNVQKVGHRGPLPVSVS